MLDPNRYLDNSKTFLHVAVELKHKQIISYLIFDAKVDTNKLTVDSQMGPLHIAAFLKSNDIIELLLTCERTDINLMSPIHGTPLHVACRGGNVKVIQ
jgi:ankyrin repeat protein